MTLRGSTTDEHDMTLKKNHRLPAKSFTRSVIGKGGFLLYYDLNKIPGFNSFYKTVAQHAYDKLAIYSQGGTKKVGVRYAELIFIDACLNFAKMFQSFEAIKTVIKGA